MYRQYETIELSYSASEPNGSFVQVDFSAEFTRQDSEEKINVKGFYAGDHTYRIRFLPLKAGIWRYRTYGIVESEGIIDVKKAVNNHHGPVRAAGTHLRFEDGNWFHSFGTTVYALAHQSDELTAQTFDSLARAPFNKVRMCVFPKHYNYNHNDPKYFPFQVLPGMKYSYQDALASPMGANEEQPVVWDVHHPDFRYWDRLEDLIRRMDEMGIQVDLILFHPYDRWGFARMTQKDNLVYLDYLTRRLSAIPNLWWSLANEYDLCKYKGAGDWEAFEQAISEGDPYHHMLSNHNCFPLYDFSHETITHCSCQLRTMNLVDELQKKYQKPVLYDECVYEGNLMQSWGSLSAQEMTNRFWKVTVTGGYCTHGEVLLDQTEENVEEAVLWWAKGGKLKGKSPERIAYLRTLIEEIDQPLNPMEIGLASLASLTDESIHDFLAQLPPGTEHFIRSFLAMDRTELIRHLDAEYEYAGMTEDKRVLLYYYNTECRARVQIDLPAGRKYRIEVIDTWNMNREIVKEEAEGSVIVRLPGREYMAVLAKALQ